MGVDAPVVVGGIIPEADRPELLAQGVAAVYTPKDFELATIMRDVADLAVAHRSGRLSQSAERRLRRGTGCWRRPTARARGWSRSW